jgi:hypothetical protein
MNLMSGSGQSAQVIEHELDMNRQGSRAALRMSRLKDLLRLLTPGGRAMGPPMRSVDRELQEVWPARER